MEGAEIRARQAANAEVQEQLEALAAQQSSQVPGGDGTAQKLQPGEADATRFTLHPSVQQWQWHSKGWSHMFSAHKSSEEPPDLQGVLSRLATLSTSGDATTATYWAYHVARFSFFITQGVAGLVAHQASESLNPPPASAKVKSPEPAAAGSAPVHTPLQRLTANGGRKLTNRLVEAMGTWEQDLAWIQSGHYKLPWDMLTPNRQYQPLFIARRTLDFMQECAATLTRRFHDAKDPVWIKSGMYPQYYTSTYHHQTDGWFSDRSSDIYEHSTEVLFSGRQDAMQRSALPPISEYVSASSTPPANMRLLEVAAGTGRFHTFLKDNWPEMRSVCSDLSPFYLARARRNMQEWKALRQPNRWLGGTDDTGVEYMQMAAEKLTVPDASFDIVVCVYLFHELPETIRRKSVAEMFRVLKPGGLCVLTDSAQLGDRTELDKSIGAFSKFDEPYYVSYIKEDLGAMFEAEGFQCGTKYVSCVTKTLSFTKPTA